LNLGDYMAVHVLQIIDFLLLYNCIVLRHIVGLAALGLEGQLVLLECAIFLVLNELPGIALKSVIRGLLPSGHRVLLLNIKQIKLRIVRAIRHYRLLE
jgi:hypothetical protein